MASEIMHVRLGDEDLGSFDFQKLTVFDTIQLKAKSGLSTKEFINGLSDLDGVAMQTLVWLLRTRKGEQVELHAINFAIGELDIQDEPDPTTETPSGSDAASTSVS